MRNYEQYLEDLSQLTGLTKLQVMYLMKICRLLVGHEIYEGIVEDVPKYESFCVGVGKLGVEYNPSTDDYDVSFKLSKDMKIILDKVLDKQESPLIEELDKAMVEQISSRFKELLGNGE